MREARLIVPQGALDPRLPRRLSERFGGYTMTIGQGGWKGPDGMEYEDVYVFDIAVDEFDLLQMMALDHEARLMVDRGQKSVYLRYPDGVVRFITEGTEKDRVP